MHEVSIALSLIDVVSNECRKGGYSRVELIHVRIGRASGVMPDALIFAFDAVKAESVADGATLSVEEVPVGGICADCNRDFTVGEEYVLNCPLCGGTSFRMTAGREMDIVDMEVS